MITIKEILEEKDWHPEKLVINVPLPQTFWYGQIQKERGRKVFRFEFLKDTKTIGFGQFVAYPLMGNLTYWYASYGPIVPHPDKEIFEAIKKEITAKAKKSQVVFVRLDFTPTLSMSEDKDAGAVFTKTSKTSGSGSYYQPRYEWYTDISRSDNDILMAMHEKTRYSVRLATRKGVKTEIIYEQDLSGELPDFLSLLTKTGQRNNFAIHDDDYYKYFLAEIAKRDNGFLVKASLGDKILAMHFVVVEGEVAHYVFGGSSDEMKSLCAPYLAHFEGMREAKRRGASFYNFGGISEALSNPHWESITVFKKKFGGAVFSHSQYFDIIIKPALYYLYNLRKLIKSFK